MEVDTIVVGDCLDVMAEMPDGCVDLVIADPPYSTFGPGGRGKLTKGDWFSLDMLPVRGWFLLMHLVCSELRRISKSQHHIYVLADWRSIRMAMDAMESTGIYLRNLIVWDKKHFGVGTDFRYQHELIVLGTKDEEAAKARRHDLGNILYHKRPKNGYHPTEKPEGLIRNFIEVSTDVGDMIFDPFMGSGTTAIAALKLGRHFYGCDINPGYVKLANERVAKARLEMAQLPLDIMPERGEPCT